MRDDPDGKGGGGERSAAVAGLNGGWSRGGVESETTKDTCKITSYFYVKSEAPNLTNAGLDFRIHPKFHSVKRRFSITLKCRHIYRVLNIDKIKN
jgi:hypothetical protein